MAYSSFTKPRKRLNKIGSVGKRRLAANKVRKTTHPKQRCEIASILKARGITFTRCFGDLEYAHSRKCHKRGNDPVLEETFCIACAHHHRFVLDLLKPSLTEEIVLKAIADRGKYE